MATRTPLILNQITARIEELAVGDTLAANFVEGFYGKNRLINGNFDIYQRGNPGTITNTAAYTADRWVCSSAGAGVTSNWGSAKQPRARFQILPYSSVSTWSLVFRRRGLASGLNA